MVVLGKASLNGDNKDGLCRVGLNMIGTPLKQKKPRSLDSGALLTIKLTKLNLEYFSSCSKAQIFRF
jgi:hypothetical protein